MLRRKLLAIFFAIVLLSTLSIQVFAEDVVEPEVSEPSASSVWVDTVLSTIETHTHGDVTVTYTSDSVVRAGVSYEVDIDILAQQVYLVIVTDLPAGYEVYDNPGTEAIDGIRVNGATTSTYRVPIDYTKDIDYEVIVRTAYAEGTLGALAQMSDGTYDWAKLLENPYGVLMALYYALAIVLVVVSIVSAWRGKSKKVKSSEETAAAVIAAAQNATAEAIQTQVLPIVTTFQNTAQNLVKAYAISTSKNKEAPIALLDILQEVSTADAQELIEHAKQSLSENQAKLDEARQNTISNLNRIARTIQEGNDNATQKSRTEEATDVAIF